jgi:SAM-dependent methyltransferase
MTATRATDVWAVGAAYEAYVGRWSRLVAREFVPWLRVSANGVWVDVGCGTGALVEEILSSASPRQVEGVDSSDGFIANNQRRIVDRRASFRVGDARALPQRDESADAVVSGLVLNFVQEPSQAVREMRRVARPGTGVVAAYVWDYGDRMDLMRYFWQAAVELDPDAKALDEGRRFPMCWSDPLRKIFSDAGLEQVEVRAIDVPTRFRDFDDYWSPFLGGQGPAPAYAMSLSEERRARLRERVRAALPVAADGSIDLLARAWAVRGLRQD